MSNVTIFDWNSTLFLIILFTITLFFIAALIRRSRNDNNDKEFDYDRACPDCHRLLKKDWKNCPFCGHKEKE